MRAVLKRLFPDAEMMSAAIDVLQDQREIIRFLQEEASQRRLEYARNTRDLIEHFLITLEAPELHAQVRDHLIASLFLQRGHRSNLMRPVLSLLSGSGGSGETGTTLSVLDSHNNWEEIQRVYARSFNLKRKREELLAWVRDLNARESTWT